LRFANEEFEEIYKEEMKKDEEKRKEELEKKRKEYEERRIEEEKKEKERKEKEKREEEYSSSVSSSSSSSSSLISSSSSSSSSSSNITSETNMDENKYSVDLVIDYGSGITKIGIAGKNEPKFVFPTTVARRKPVSILSPYMENMSELLVGSNCKKKYYEINHPISHGEIIDNKDMEKIWEEFFGETRDEEDNFRVLFAESPSNSEYNRRKLIEVMFEKFGISALYFQNKAVLSLLASGRTTGVVLQSGDDTTYAVPIVDGNVLPHATEHLNIGGRDVEESLLKTLTEEDYRNSKYVDDVKYIKENYCYVANNLNFKDPTYITLWNGDSIRIESGLFTAPETLFESRYYSIQEIILRSIRNCDISIRKEMYENIVLSGGNTMLKGFEERLHKELVKEAPQNTSLNIVAPGNRNYLAWKGGALLANMSTFEKMWVSKKEYDEHGENAIKIYDFMLNKEELINSI
jgi:actin-related protein